MSAKKMFKSLKITAVLLLPLLFAAVKCSKVSEISPEYQIAAPEGFYIKSFVVTPKNPNFAKQKVTFSAKFSSRVTWFIDLNGQQSGAFMKISGTSDTIDPANTAWIWDGSHQGQFFFRAGEPIAVTLSVLGSTLTMVDTIAIAKVKTFKDILVGDFETTTALGNQWPSWIASPEKNVYYENPPKQLDRFVKGQYVTDGYVDTIYGHTGFKVLQGKQAFRMSGEDTNGSYFVCGIRREKLPFVTLAAGKDPSNIYFNLYVYGFGDPSSKLNFGAQEDDNDADPGAALGVSDPKSDDEFQTQISLNFTGWRMISVRYSDFQAASDPLNGGNGNRVHEPTRITGITFGLISSPAKNYVSAIFDYPIITFDAPFDPAK